MGLMIAKRLSQRLGRPFSYFQSGPYNQQKPPSIGINFSDPIFHFIDPVDAEGSVDFRFGYYVHRYYSKLNDTWIMHAGFELLNQTLAQRFFTRNLRSGADSLAIRLHHWLNGKGDRSFANFGVDVTEKYQWKLDDSLDLLAEQLRAYGELGRRKKGVGWAITRFQIGAEVNAFQNYSEESLEEEADRISKVVADVFEELDFLYKEIFPRHLDPARMSGGQSRALSKVQPDRICSWLDDSDCLGQIEAAHLVPDRQGGPATADNLIWLCQCHHQIVDRYLKAIMTPDPRFRKVLASVTSEAPSYQLMDGLPWRYWRSIVTKTNWHMPLKEKSIRHLFDRGLTMLDNLLED